MKKVKGSSLIETVVAAVILGIAFLFFLASFGNLYRSSRLHVTDVTSLELEKKLIELKSGELIPGTTRSSLTQGNILITEIQSYSGSEELFLVLQMVLDSAHVKHEVRRHLILRQ